MSKDTTTVRVPFRTHQKVRDWAIRNNFSVPDAWAHLAELGLEDLELAAESERIPEAEPTPWLTERQERAGLRMQREAEGREEGPSCMGCGRDGGHESWCEENVPREDRR